MTASWHRGHGALSGSTTSSITLVGRVGFARVPSNPISIAAFHTMIRKKAAADLDCWLKRARTSLVASFANGVIKDKAAVSAAISSSWSNGQTEGQITKLKLVKRQMYGRANFDLLPGPADRRLITRIAPKMRQSPVCTPITPPTGSLFHAETHGTALRRPITCAYQAMIARRRSSRYS